MEAFGHVQVLWWFHECDNEISRAKRVEHKPYTKGPEELGIFATRSPERPNPIALSCARITYVDQNKGIVGLSYIDAHDEGPVLDIKPYTASLDRLQNPEPAPWCSHWPQSCEASADFDWQAEFNFE